ncbi:MAG: T9SS type A sorting domain-containing protein [Candidatus Kapabacteria bacterium]|nr:T9SS type A sorting domain-containing protein [Ignavibacteriota bacterium]MCW5885103.1 T9SS type A sorting domain-containing protein [Candidatus Kapabacteria bacterium]
MKKLAVYLLFLSLTYSYSAIPEYMLIEGFTPETKHTHCESGCCSQKYDFNDNATLQSIYPRKNYDVLTYDLSIDLSYFLFKADMDNENLDTLFAPGKQKITLKIDSNDVNSFIIDAVDLTIENINILSDYTSDNFSYEIKEQFIQFNSKIILKAGDIINIEIDYNIHRAFKRGIYFYGRNTSEQNLGSEPIIYTQSQPTNTKYWMPCNDAPYDKAITSVTITVPSSFTALSNGNLDSIKYSEVDDIILETYYYSHDKPLSPYLTTVVASKYSSFEQYYQRVTNPLDTVVFTNYMWDIDLNPPTGHPYNGRFYLRNQPNMMAVYASLFGEYTFDKYGTVAVFPYMFGGMEHQTLTTIHRNWLRRFSETGLTHEIAHHWIGNLLTCASWNDIWINEGGATWFEALWYEAANQDGTFYYNHLLGVANAYFNRPNKAEFAVYGVPESQVFIQTHITYLKASWVYHMLAELVGRDYFFQVMHDIFEGNKFRSVTTEEFIELFKLHIQNPKMDLDLYFSQWLYGKGHPIYRINAEFPDNNPDKYEYDVFISQVQDPEQSYQEVYEMWIDILFLDDNDNLLKSESVYNNSRNQKFSFEFDFPVQKILIDYRKVLCEIEEFVVSVSDNRISKAKVRIAPNPALSGESINLFYDNDVNITRIKIFDLTGNLIYQKDGNSLNQINFALPQGFYIAEFRTKYGIIREKLIIN